MIEFAFLSHVDRVLAGILKSLAIADLDFCPFSTSKIAWYLVSNVCDSYFLFTPFFPVADLAIPPLPGPSPGCSAQVAVTDPVIPPLLGPSLSCSVATEFSFRHADRISEETRCRSGFYGT